MRDDMKAVQLCSQRIISFVMFAALGLDVVTSESLFGYESSNKDMLAIVAAADLSGERIVLPDTSQFLHPSVQVSGSTASVWK
jgi:hypothetical protein